MGKKKKIITTIDPNAPSKQAFAPEEKVKPQKATWESTRKKHIGVEDLTLLSKLTNAGINENLKKRYMADYIYTYIGHVLICVNPFKDLGYYTSENVETYYSKQRIELPPHVFAIANEAHHNMVAYEENQCIIISGESGAGKTEAAKQIMQFIAEVSGDSPEVIHTKNVILGTNPLLEAFGNAKTLRNDNSSRFGKFFELQFNLEGDPTGGFIHNYLLEKSRVVCQIEGERNFHIFYQLTRGAGQDLEDFQIYGPESYFITSMSGSMDVPGVDDSAEFQETIAAMNTCGITADEQKGIWRLLAAILWLGNIEFKERKGGAYPTDMSTLEFGAYLLDSPPEMLKEAMTSRLMETQHGLKRGTVYQLNLNKGQAESAREALCKTIYDRIFDFLIAKINSVLKQTPKALMIGVLDIYGFEIFQQNGFEQLCINYVNEKLQQIFIELTLKQEQEEYIRENIKWEAIDYFDNKIVCDMIESKAPPGVLSIMDDACATAHAEGEQCDSSFLQRCGTLNNNKHFDLRGKSFCVKHYAGDVVYYGMGMTDRNKDIFAKGLLETVKMSKNKFILGLFPEEVKVDDKKRPTTAGFKIRKQCNSLMEALKRCKPHYVRTIKPNENRAAHEYDENRVLHQIKYLGLLENVRVRRAGWAFRQEYKKFLYHFFLLSPRTSYAAEYVWDGDDRGGCKCVLEDCGIMKEEWQIGTSKVFLRHPETLWAMEHLKQRYFENMAMRIQRMFHAWKWRRNISATKIQRSYREWAKVRIYFQLKNYSQELLQNNKERRRFSLLAFRHFHADYLESKSNEWLQEVIPGIETQQILFSGKIQTVISKGFGGAKLSPRFLVITSDTIYVIKTELKKNIAITTLDSEVPLTNLSGLGMSKFADECLVMEFKDDETSIIAFTPFKTELASWLNWTMNKSLNVQFEDDLVFMKKKNKAAHLLFSRALEDQQEMIFKKGKISVPAYEPASSPLNPLIRKALKPKEKKEIEKKDRVVPRQAVKRRDGEGPRAVAYKSAFDDSSATSSARPSGGSDDGPQKAKAKFDFVSDNPDELSFYEGDVFTIFDDSTGDWWEVELNGVRGFVPSTYVEKIATPKPQRAPPAKKAPAKKPQAKKKAAAKKAPAAQIPPQAKKQAAMKLPAVKKAPPATKKKAPPATKKKAPPPATKKKAPPATKKKAPPVTKKKAPPPTKKKGPPAATKKAPPTKKGPPAKKKGPAPKKGPPPKKQFTSKKPPPKKGGPPGSRGRGGGNSSLPMRAPPTPTG